jgi:multiple sugar transport system permease protein
MISARPTNGLNHKLFPYIAIVPAQLMLIVILILPFLYILWFSFNSLTFGESGSFIGLDNFVRVFSTAIFWQSLWHTFIWVNIIVYGELLVGLSLAVFFSGRIPLRRLMIAIVMAPYAVSTVVGVIMWKQMLFPGAGVVSFVLESLGMSLKWTSNQVHAFTVLVLLNVWLHVPFTFIILYNSIMSVPSEILESAQIDGASSVQVLRFITLPLIFPAILVALTFRYIFGLRTFDIIWLMTGGGPVHATELLSTYLYREAFSYYRFGIASTIGLIMMVVTLLISAQYLRVLYGRMFKSESRT